MTKLNSAWEIKPGKLIKNHFVLAPMVNHQSENDGSLGEDELQWLNARALGGFAMIITTATNVLPERKTWVGELGIYSDTHLPGLARLADTLKSSGATPLVQIFHGGARCPSSITGVQPSSASAFSLNIPGFEQPRALNVSEVKIVVDGFIAGAKRAHKAGFAGVEIHGANGYDKVPVFAARSLKTIADMQRALDLGLDGIALAKIAIGNPDLPLHADKLGYLPLQSPYTWEQLNSAKVSSFFFEALKEYPGLIAVSE